MPELNAPGWLPDCRHVSAYPDPKSTPLPRWAWEFLRRNPEYQHAWAETIAPYLSQTTGLDDERRLAEGKPDPLRAMRKKFGTAFLPPDPADSETLPVFEHNLVRTRDHFASDELPGDETAIVFNLSRSLAPQLARAQTYLTGLKKYLETEGMVRLREKRDRSDKWRDYLRLLDGEAIGLQTTELAAIIYPLIENIDPEYAGNEAVRKGLKAARKLRDGDWRLLAMRPPGK